jgi:hypothetical protein
VRAPRGPTIVQGGAREKTGMDKRRDGARDVPAVSCTRVRAACLELSRRRVSRAVASEKTTRETHAAQLCIKNETDVAVRFARGFVVAFFVVLLTKKLRPFRIADPLPRAPAQKIVHAEA